MDLFLVSSPTDSYMNVQNSKVSKYRETSDRNRAPNRRRAPHTGQRSDSFVLIEAGGFYPNFYGKQESCISQYNACVRYSSLKHSGMACFNEGSHSSACHPHVYPQVEWTIPAFTPSRRASPYFGRYSLPVPLQVGGWVDQDGLVKYRGGLFAHSKMMAHPSTCSSSRESNLRPSSCKSSALLSQSYLLGKAAWMLDLLLASVSSFLQDCCTAPKVAHPAPWMPNVQC